MQTISTIKDIIYIFILGVAIGIVTSYGQTYLPEPFTQLANSYSIWLFGSFIIGYYTRSYWSAGIGGGVVQYLAIATYYIFSILRFDSQFTITTNLIWIIGGTIAGPIVGLLAHSLRQNNKYKVYAVPVLGSLFLSEALYLFLNLGYIGEGLIFLILGVGVIVSFMAIKKLPIIMTLLWSLLFTTIMYILYGLVVARFLLSLG